MAVLATLDSLDFHDDASSTYMVEPDGLKNWWGGVPMRHESLDRPVGVGQFDAPVFPGGRLPIINGWVFATSPTAFVVAMRALEDVLADGSMGTLAVVEPDGTYGVDVRRHDSVEFDIVKFGTAARFQLPLWAPIPTKVLIP